MSVVKKSSKDSVKEVPTKKKATGIDWAALGYEEDSSEYESADAIKVNQGPVKFKVQAKKTYRIGFPFVAPGKNGFDVRVKPVEHLKYYDEDSQSGARFVMPKDDKLRKQVIDTFSNKAIQTHYLTPVVVYDTNDEGKLLSRDAVSYSIKVLAIPAGRYAKLREASDKFSLADYDFLVTLDGDEKTEHYQKMNFTAVTVKKDLNAKTATWQKGILAQLPDDEDEEPISVSMEEVIAECYEIAPTMLEVLGTHEYKDSKIKEIISEWSDIDSDDEDDEEGYADEDEDEDDSEDIEDEDSDDEDDDESEDGFEEDDVEDDEE